MRGDELHRAAQRDGHVAHPDRLAVALAAVAPDGDGAEALQARLVGVDRVDVLVVVEDLEARLGIEVERPLVPAGRRALDAQPEQLVEPLLAVAGGGGVAFVAAQIAGVEDADGQHLPVALDQAPARADAVRP